MSRGIARAQGYDVDPNRDLIALGASNGLAGLSSGFVQSGGASQTLAAEEAGGKTQDDVDRRRRADPPHGGVPDGALRGPAPGDARRDRDRRDRRLLAGRRAGPVRAPADERDRLRARRARGRARARDPARPRRRGAPVARDDRPAAQPPVGRRPLARPGDRGMGASRPPRGLGAATGRRRRSRRRPALLREHLRRGDPLARARRRSRTPGLLHSFSTSRRTRTSTSRASTRWRSLPTASPATGSSFASRGSGRRRSSCSGRGGLLHRLRVEASIDDAVAPRSPH